MRGMLVQFAGTKMRSGWQFDRCHTQPVLQFGIYNYPKDADAAPTAQAYNPVCNSNLQCLVNKSHEIIEKGRQGPNA